MLHILSLVISATDLTQSTFDDNVFKENRPAFIKFYAPWCGHCKKLAPDWDTLTSEYADSDKVFIGSVDCTSDEGKPVCNKYNVKGYPSLQYFQPPSTTGEIYKQKRSLDELRSFVKSLSPKCSLSKEELCSESELKELKDLYNKHGKSKLESMILDYQSDLKDLDKHSKEFLENLKKQYEEFTKSSDENRKEIQDKISKFQAAIPKDKKHKDEM